MPDDVRLGSTGSHTDCYQPKITTCKVLEALPVVNHVRLMLTVERGKRITSPLRTISPIIRVAVQKALRRQVLSNELRFPSRYPDARGR